MTATPKWAHTCAFCTELLREYGKAWTLEGLDQAFSAVCTHVAKAHVDSLSPGFGCEKCQDIARVLGYPRRMVPHTVRLMLQKIQLEHWAAHLLEQAPEIAERRAAA